MTTQTKKMGELQTFAKAYAHLQAVLHAKKRVITLERQGKSALLARLAVHEALKACRTFAREHL